MLEPAPVPPHLPQTPATRGAKSFGSDTLLLVISYLGFVSLGLPDTLTGVAWPSVRETFGLPQSGLGLLLIAMGCGYIASSFFGGRLTQSLGIGTLLATSSLLVAAAMLGYAFSPGWIFMVGFAVCWGLGSGAIDAGLNAFVASHFSARHVNWLHAFYSLGATLGPLVMTAMVLRADSWRADSWRAGFGLVGALILALACLFIGTRRRWGKPPADESPAQQRVSLTMALAHPLVGIQVAIFFLYTGLEFVIGQWSFTLLTEARSVPTERAGLLAASYFGAIGMGRIVLGAAADRIGVDRLIRISLLVVVAGAALFAVGRPVEVSFLGLGLLGLGLAPIFPSLMARTPQRLGAGYAAHAVGFQVSAASLGGAVMPALAGLLAQRFGLETTPQLGLLLAVMLWALHEALLYQSARRTIS